MDSYRDPNATNTGTTVEPGDTVFVVGGRFNGCVLTFVREAERLTPRSRPSFVCINRTYGDINGHIRVPGVELYRKGNPEYAR